MMIFMAGLIFVSCYDKDNTIHRIPDLVIENVTGGSVKTGEVIEITPKCVMGGEEVECTYNWYRYRDTVLELISEDSHLEWRVDTVGSVTLEVEATHVESGIQAVLTFYYSITPRINGGWLILKETMDGNTDMDVSLIQANGIEFAADQLSLALGEPMKGKPVSLLYTESYQWYDPETGTTETKQKCLIPVSQKDILMYRVADEKVLARNEELFFEMPDFGSSNISSFMQLAQSGGLICDGKAYLRSNVAFMPALLGNYHLAPNVVCWKYNNPMLVYDELNTSFGLLVGSSNFSTTMEIKYFADDYQPDDDLRISPNRMDAELIYLGQTDKSILSDPNKQGYGTAYALMKKNGDANNLLLYGLTVAEWYNATYGPIRFARTIPVSRCEAFATADFYTMHQTNNLIYFIKDNQLSYYDIDNDEFVENIHTFEGEVTYCKYIGNDYDYNTATWLGELYENRFERLVVATSSGANYTVHVFDWSINEGLTLLPSEEVKGEGKVHFMLWFPRNTSNFFNSIYRYS